MERVDEFIRQLETGNDDERYQAAELLGQIGDLNAVPELLNAYETRKGFLGVPIIEAVGEILGRTSPNDDNSREIYSRAVDTLIEAVQDDMADDDARAVAAEALGKSRDPKAIPVLTKQLLVGFSTKVLKACARALRHFNDPEVAHALIRVATNKKLSENLRQAAVESLGDIRNPQAVDTLIRILEDRSDNSQIRIEAARALGRTDDAKAIEPMIRTLESERGSVAGTVGEAIAKALGAFRDPRVTDALVKALAREYHIARGASESLKKLRDRRAVEPLIRLVDPPDDKANYRNHEREFAAQILGVLGDPRAIPALAKALHDDYCERLPQYAAESLQSFILTHPDAILRIPPDDRNLMGRFFQDAQRNELLQEICGHNG